MCLSRKGEFVMETKKKNWLFMTLLCLAFGMAYEPVHADLDEKYLRNGETYLLIGSGSKKGVYRLDNPTNESDPYVISGDPVITKEALGDNKTIALAVDLWRDLYTFTNTGSEGMIPRDYIWRQVLDNTIPQVTLKNNAYPTQYRNKTISKDQTSDYGEWDLPHTDSRPSGKKGNIYRTVSSSTDTQRTVLGSVKALKPGTNGSFVENKPSWYQLPACQEFVNKDLDFGVFSGKTWYKIPNRSWYSTWKQNKLSNNYISTTNKAYMCFYDDESADTNIYNKWIWYNKNKTNSSKNYSEYDSTHGDGGEIARTESINITRYVCAGCLDSCTQKTAPGSYESATMTCDIAMQPGLLLENSNTERTADRTYALTRSVGSTDCTLTLNNSNYTGLVKGYRNNTDSQWIGISLKDTNSDFVYALGNTGLKSLYENTVPNGNARNFEFTAVTVSNQWDQKGGIIYAYEKKNNMVYRFTCDDVSGNNATINLAENNSWEAINVSQIISELGGDSVNACVDDIKADGFGSLYLGVSFPSVNAGFDARKAIRPTQGNWVPVHFHAGEHSDEKGTNIEVIYPVDYGKYIFKKEYNSELITEVGHKALGTTYYSFIVTVPVAFGEYAVGNDVACINELNNASKSSYFAILRNHGGKVNDVNLVSVPWGTENTPVQRVLPTPLICDCWQYHQSMGSVENPTNCKLAVINVPTPPRVKSIYDKKSYLDICGPYTEVPDLGNNSTNQNSMWAANYSVTDSGVSVNPLDDLTFMVENYPLPSGAQNPNDFPDYDSDTRYGGFVSTIENVKENITYEWKIWCVHNGYKPVCKLKRTASTNSTSYGYGRPYTTFCYDVGKYIIACRVKYNWYDYDALPFGSTISRRNDVLRSNVFAFPSNNGFPGCEAVNKGELSSSARLEQIKNTPEFSFMKNAVDSAGNPIDYSVILDGDSTSKQKWAFESVVVSGTPAPAEETSEVASIERCDGNPAVAANWASAPVNLTGNLSQYNGIFGVESEKTYYWRVSLASQTNLCIDIEHTNGTNPNDKNSYNYIADRTLNPHQYRDSNGNTLNNPLYIDPSVPLANGKYVRFNNDVGDLTWDDNEIQLSAYLYREVPGVSGVQKTVIKDVEAVPVGNSLYIRTKKDLPVTDPGSATIEIVMRRDYTVTLQYLDPNTMLPTGAQKEKSKHYNLIGRAQINVIDVKKPTICYNETTPNNLYAYTGESIVSNSVKTLNPTDVQFTVKDNNPWDGGDRTGISLRQHLLNYTYNFGLASASQYAQLTDALKDTWENQITSSEKSQANSNGSTNGRGVAGKQFNLLPLFCRDAADVRLYFETARLKVDGTIDVGRADSIYNTNLFPFTKDNSAYAFNYRESSTYSSLGKNGNTSVGSIIYDDTSASNNDGELTSYFAKTTYKIPVSAIKMGVPDANGSLTNDRIPDYYANNTPGYKPYKFYVSAIDCSGNFLGDNLNTSININENNSQNSVINIGKELNLRLNVADNIPPVAYGSLKEMKGLTTSYFPYKTKNCQNAYSDVNNTTAYSYSERNGFGDNLPNSLLRPAEGSADRAVVWLPDETADGYVNGIASYQSIRPLGDNARLGSKKEVGKLFYGRDANKKTVVDLYPLFKNQVEAHLSPQVVEDNVECILGVNVSDNCAANAVATFSITMLSPEMKETDYHVSTKGYDYTRPDLASGSTRLVFRGLLDDFPMAVPVLICAEDDAKDFSHFNVSSTEDSFTWDDSHEVGGSPLHNVRFFRTVIPVIGSKLDIRTLDKSIKKDKANFGN